MVFPKYNGLVLCQGRGGITLSPIYPLSRTATN